jgi:hypothetical protein
LDKQPKMNAAIANDLRLYARKRWPMAHDKFRKGRLASLLEVSERRIRSLWNGEETAVLRQGEVERIRKLVGQEQLEERNIVAFRDLASRVSRLEALLAASVAKQDHQPLDNEGRGIGDGRGEHVSRTSERG